jgi:AraC-like DNA-binding protein
MNGQLKHLTEQDWLKLARQAKWSVAKIAKLCHFSERTLERHFLKTIHLTPKAWLTEHRQKQAVGLLLGGFMVKQAASHLGYKNPETFSREFKKRCGKCPNTLALKSMNKPLPARNVA